MLNILEEAVIAVAKAQAQAQAKNKKVFCVTFSDRPLSPLVYVAANEAAAKRQAGKYKRAWQIDADILKVEEIPRKQKIDAELLEIILL